MSGLGKTVIICGGRDYSDAGTLRHALCALDAAHGPLEIVEGGASGADRLAREWARERGNPVRTFPADWAAHGRAAGPIRNEQMLREANPDFVVAFPGGRGTENMVALAKAAGVQLVRIA